MRYDWLEDRKQQARAEKASGQRPYYTPSFRERFSMYTGNGNNGTVEPMNPTHLLQTNRGPRVIDEGERLDVDPRTGQYAVIPASQVGGQMALDRLQKERGIPKFVGGYSGGFQVGERPPLPQIPSGGIPDVRFNDNQVVGRVPTPQTITLQDSISNSPGSVTQTSGSGRGRSGSGGYSGPYEIAEGVFVNPQPFINTGRNDSISSSPSSVTQTSGSGRGVLESGRNDSISNAPSSVTQTSGSGRGVLEYKQNDSISGSPGSVTQTSGSGRGVLEYRQNEPVVAGRVSTPQTISLQQPEPAKVSKEETTPTSRSTEAYNILRQNALRGSTAMDIAGRKAAEDVAGRQAVERAVAAQEAAMGGLPEGTAAARQARLRAQQAGELSDIETKYGIAKAQGQETAQGQLGQEARTLESHEFAMRSDKSKQEYDEFLRAAEYGDDATVSAAYEKYFGRPITDAAMVNDIRNYARTTRAQNITSGDLSIRAKELGLTADTYNTANALIGAGYDLAEVNKALGLNLNQGQFDSIRQYTPAGQTDFTRASTAFNAMMASGDPENIKKAAETLWPQMFPGLGASFNVGKIISDIGADNFAKGMEGMTTLAGKFKTWEEAVSSAEGLGVLTNLGFVKNADGTYPPAAQHMFNQLKVNAIDEEWDAIENSTTFQRMLGNGELGVNDPLYNPDSANLIRNAFTAGLTGELYYDIEDEYTVVNSKGQTVKKFANIADANSYIAKNPDAGYTVNTTKKFTMKSLTGDTTNVNINNGPAPGSQTPSGLDLPEDYFEREQFQNKSPGDYVTSDGNTYRLDNGGKWQTVMYDETNPWSDNNLAIIAGGTTNKQYSTAIKAVVDDIKSGNIEAMIGMDINDPIYKAVVGKTLPSNLNTTFTAAGGKNEVTFDSNFEVGGIVNFNGELYRVDNFKDKGIIGNPVSSWEKANTQILTMTNLRTGQPVTVDSKEIYYGSGGSRGVSGGRATYDPKINALGESTTTTTSGPPPSRTRTW